MSIKGVIVEPLKQRVDERGRVLHMLRCDSPLFEGFGEIYFSTVRPGVVKAWKLHKKMTLNLAVPSGKIKLVLYDDRDGSPTQGMIQELFIGDDDDYVLVKIPPLIWTGFQGISHRESIVANCATIPHDPDEVVRMDPYDRRISYNW